MAYLLDVADVFKSENDVNIIRGISFTQKKSQRIAIAGESGAGKTTLLKIIGGLTQPDAGQVLFAGKKVEGPMEKLIPGHPQIAYLSQHFELRNHYRVEEILDYASKISSSPFDKLVHLCRIDSLLKRWTHELSGGERQRIALTRLLVSSPKLLLLDEPFSNLDPAHRNILKSVIENISESTGTTCLLTSHDPNDILSWAEEIIVIRNGSVVQQCPSRQMYDKPVDEYVAGLFGRYMPITKKLMELFPALGRARKNSFLRPEHFTMVDGPSAGVPVTVTSVKFMGGYFDVEAMVDGEKLFLSDRTGKIAPGQTINIILLP